MIEIVVVVDVVDDDDDDVVVNDGDGDEGRVALDWELVDVPALSRAGARNKEWKMKNNER